MCSWWGIEAIWVCSGLFFTVKYCFKEQIERIILSFWFVTWAIGDPMGFGDSYNF
jgi:hypothetical protein